ncbi:MAG: leucine-rich repeat protein [Muribaculaceae bacterium]|nr:leucine-rich repeat protein [Muribaculaceae bacterium]
MKKFLLSIALMVSATMCWAVSQEVECTPGNLANLVTNYNVTSLTITGQMDARDFKFISDNLDALTSIDLSGVSIVPYSNTSNPLFNNEVSYAENCIPPMAFFGKKVSQVTLPAGTRAIGKAAFAGCKQLVSIDLPEGIDSIASFAFSSSAVGRITIPTTLKSLGMGAFAHCQALLSANVMPSSPMALPKDAFLDCMFLNVLSLGPNVIAIGDGALSGTPQLKTITFTGQNNIASIGRAAFVGSGITNFNFAQSSGLSEIKDWAFAQSKQVSATIPASVNNLGKGAFYYASELTSFIPNQNCDTIADMLLAGTAITNDNAAGTKTRYIGNYAFYNTPITELTLPATLEYMGTQAMAGTTELQELTSKARQVPELGEDVWLGVNQASIPLKVPRPSYDAYTAAAQWQDFLVTATGSIEGDVNQDGTVTSADITALYNYLLNNDMTFYETSDVNGDGAVNSADITLVYNIIMGSKNISGRNKSVRNDNDKMNADGFTIEAGNTHTMDVELINTAGFSAMQLDLTMPQGLSITSVATTSRASEMAMGYNEIEPGKWRILISSATAMQGNEGTLFNITVQADDYFSGNNAINIDNIIAVEPNELVHFINDLTVEVGTTTGVKNINVDSVANGPVDVYNMNGQLLRHNVERSEATQGLPQGIYIVGGKKVIVR